MHLHASQRAQVNTCRSTASNNKELKRLCASTWPVCTALNPRVSRRTDCHSTARRMQLAATVMLEQLTGSAEALKEKEKEVAGSSDVLRTWATQYSLPSEEVCISLYAWFDYNMLHRKHWEHHNHTGEVGKDPDFHRGNPGIVPWFASFMSSYMSMWQFARLAWWTVVMQLLGAPMANLLVFMAAAPILSAFRLFYFGTYMPHKPEPGAASGSSPAVMNWWKSRTSQASDLVSFLTCYHFDLHWEHHRWPFAPWWELPNCRRLSGRGLVPA
ncbi:beta-carotene C-4 oxygenase (Ketolase) [Haematococcus lacustris]|uniref:Beta-carotene C-4 oxygenase (Ketolase) n=1 Tax=Haematococcus lacustris TaxID=44745 RepID=A0A699Z301_HAELA|nr:beta-carotene C-4 oxygenase (Ketolase) [Haematococcus lacustris]